LVLDIPCGTGIYTAALSDQGYEVIAADASMPMLETTGKRGLDLFRTLGDINRLPFADSSIDAVIVLRLFSHFPKDEIAHMLVELRRVIRPGGRIVFDSFRWSPRYWPGLCLIFDRSHIYPIRDRQVETLIRGAGLSKLGMRATYLFSPIWQRKLPLWMLEWLSCLEQWLPQAWLLRPFWACTKNEVRLLTNDGALR
jgi:SAM-dependent methyltransferase